MEGMRHELLNDIPNFQNPVEKTGVGWSQSKKAAEISARNNLRQQMKAEAMGRATRFWEFVKLDIKGCSCKMDPGYKQR